MEILSTKYQKKSFDGLELIDEWPHEWWKHQGMGWSKKQMTDLVNVINGWMKVSAGIRINQSNQGSVSTQTISALCSCLLQCLLLTGYRELISLYLWQHNKHLQGFSHLFLFLLFSLTWKSCQPSTKKKSFDGLELIDEWPHEWWKHQGMGWSKKQMTDLVNVINGWMKVSAGIRINQSNQGSVSTQTISALCSCLLQCLLLTGYRELISLYLWQHNKHLQGFSHLFLFLLFSLY